MDIAREILKPIFTVTESVFEAYDDLKKLELAGSTESVEFKNTVERLKSSLFLEENFYNKLGDDVGILTKLLASITLPVLSWDFEVDLLIAQENHNIDLMNRRVALRIVDKINNTGKKTFLTEIITENQQCSDKILLKYTKLGVMTRNDVINTVLMLLNIQIESETDEIVRSKLIEFKYNISIIYQFVEEDLIDHNFSINPNLYWFSGAISNLEKLDDNFTKIYQKIYAEKIKRPIYDLLCTEKSVLENKSVYFESLISQILIRVKLLFGGKEAEKEISKIISSHKNESDTAVDMIKEAYEKRVSDAEIPQSVTFKL